MFAKENFKRLSMFMSSPAHPPASWLQWGSLFPAREWKTCLWKSAIVETCMVKAGGEWAALEAASSRTRAIGWSPDLRSARRQEPPGAASPRRRRGLPPPLPKGHFVVTMPRRVAQQHVLAVTAAGGTVEAHGAVAVLGHAREGHREELLRRALVAAVAIA